MDPYPGDLRALVGESVSRLVGRVGALAPTLAISMQAWMRALAGQAELERYLTHPRAFPMLLLPWWLEEVIRGTVARGFQADVVYSTISGYCFVRLVDDLMDGDEPPAPAVLPALTVLHTEFVEAYRGRFPADSPFWHDLVEASYAAAESASLDAGLDDIDRERFLAVSARKIAGAKVPIAAVCHRYGRTDLVAPWSGLVDRLGPWHQMLNDVLDWARDRERGRTTYFLSEAERQAPGAPLGWLLGDGLGWGYGQVEAWMEEAQAYARELECPPLDAYLAWRRADLASEWQEVSASLSALGPLLSREV